MAQPEVAASDRGLRSLLAIAANTQSTVLGVTTGFSSAMTRWPVIHCELGVVIFKNIFTETFFTEVAIHPSVRGDCGEQ